MATLDNIPDSGNWGDAATKLNNNFRALNVDVEKAKNASVKAKGLFPTIADLRAAYPSPVKGDWAVVGSTIPGLVYECRTNGTWVSTGQQGGGGDIDLTGYITSTKITDITEIL